MNPLDPKTWPADMQFLYRERAAIKEYCGGLERVEAEKQARIEVWERTV